MKRRKKEVFVSVAAGGGNSPPDVVAEEPRPSSEHYPAPAGDRSPVLGWAFAVALVVAVFLSYQPAWQGGRVWDDDEMITPVHLQSWQGLQKIWTEKGTTGQYYPVTFTLFWVEHRLWGDVPLGYHLVNILLHATSALLVASILGRLKVPGAYLAAAIFALHPVHVESVAWMSELKNTLSGVFYLAAARVYLGFDQSRTKRAYCAALMLFIVALLSKTVTATLPAALLVVFWWQRGRLSWKQDVLPLVPFFGLGAALGLMAVWLERSVIGAEGSVYMLTIVERCLLAGRVPWFYLRKLLWPTELIFVYPRWEISQTVWWQYLFPLALVALLGVLWRLRQRWRGPLAGTLVFVGTLLPVLGFFNVYPFQYSFVADHFQYLASLGVIVPIAAGAALLLQRRQLWGRPAGLAICLAMLAVLAALTWRQSHMYTDIVQLWRTTIDRNPQCWMAHHNLGQVLWDLGQAEEAVAEFHKSLDIKPKQAKPMYNLGIVATRSGRPEEGIAWYRKAVEAEPDYADAHNNLAIALFKKGEIDEALRHFQMGAQGKHPLPEVNCNFGNALLHLGKPREAIAQYEQALKLNPDYAEAHAKFGDALMALWQIESAIPHYQRALELRPDNPETHNNFGLALARWGQTDAAIGYFGSALALKPDFAEAHNMLGSLLAGRRQYDEAQVHYEAALKSRPDFAEAHYGLAGVLVARKQIADAIIHYRKALELNPDFVAAHAGVADALADCGQIDEAIVHYRKLLELVPNLAEAHNMLGNLLIGRRKYDEAFVHYQAALKARPDFAEAHNNLANLLAGSGQLDEAIAHYQQALKAKPDYADARGNLERAMLRREKTRQQQSDSPLPPGTRP